MEDQMSKGAGFDTAESTPTQPARVLATINFVGATMVNNGQSRFQHREAWLNLGQADRVTYCRDCQKEIALGERCAVGLLRECYCLGCCAWMTEAEALQHSETRNCEPAERARLKGEKYGVLSYRSFGHAVSVAQGRGE